ncbi:MAG TPA: 16S rRNA (cytosine(967)-C(5))-methyltransferase RsmB [Chthoniobacteraceae bacterium]|nr:16S rRNA (cytosine(967)-C(5))-methyltransferase RsmB [Chthoniobacteraceae bacterium]
MSVTHSSSSAANPRWATIQALAQWQTGSRFADEVLHDAMAAHRFGSFERAFLTETFYGILRHQSALDFLISQLRETPLDPLTRQVLRLGFYQIFRMRIPHHAAVNETVNLAGRAKGLVNALLRRSIREKEALLERLAAMPLAVRASHPQALVDRWEAAFGPGAAEALCEWNNTPAEMYARSNRLKVTAGELQTSLADAQPTPLHPQMLKLRHLPHAAIAHGLCYIQDPSTLLAVELLGAQPGETVLDACAAPGGKASAIAEAMENRGVLQVCDNASHRLERLSGNLRRLGVSVARPVRIDWLTESSPFPEAHFDRILADVPCSNTGVIRRRVDVRWRLSDDDFATMPERQREIVFRLVPLLKPGGTFVYSTCSLEAEENDEVVKAILQRFPELELLETRRSVPFRDGMDGAFAVKLHKRV